MKGLGVTLGAGGGALLGYGLIEHADKAVSIALWMIGISLVFTIVGVLFEAAR